VGLPMADFNDEGTLPKKREELFTSIYHGALQQGTG